MAHTVVHVVGARPNFVKLAPLYRALATRRNLRQVVVHTGQHWDARMSANFFRDLKMPPPDINLDVRARDPLIRLARMIVALARIYGRHEHCLVSVFGDVDTALAAAVAAARKGIAIAHVEAGLRSFDRSMPEEVNRVVVDHLADLLLAPSPDAVTNLRREGIPAERIHFVGNVMVDTLKTLEPKAKRCTILERLGLRPRCYAVCTLHRPENVDDARNLGGLLRAICSISRMIPVVFPVHPRTRDRIERAGLMPQLASGSKVFCLAPLAYLDFLALTSRAKFILTDSGGLQEEATVLRIPCLTLRRSTERPITVTMGTNQLVGADPSSVIAGARSLLRLKRRSRELPPRWDGRAATRIARLYGHFLIARAGAYQKREVGGQMFQKP